MIIINKDTKKSYNLNPNNKIAYDGCHKIYICESNEDMEKAKELGFKIHELNELEDLFKKSCPLVFIYNWNFTEYYVGQGEDAEFFH